MPKSICYVQCAHYNRCKCHRLQCFAPFLKKKNAVFYLFGIHSIMSKIGQIKNLEKK